MPCRPSSRSPLTPRQAEVLACIRDALRREGRPPTLREIGAAVGICSTNGVSEHLRALEAKGFLDRAAGSSRGLRLKEALPSPEPRRRIPLLGRIAAGRPILADENVEGELEVAEDLPGLSGHRDLFALRVSGDSMIGDGILDGDVIFVAPAAEAPPGSIVVALLDDEATVKRCFPEPDGLRLEASNPAVPPLRVRESDGRRAVIQGQVVGVYRRVL